MSFPRYEAYKDSGIDWLREVPARWRLTRIKSLFRFVKRQDQLDLAVLSVYREFGVIEKSSRDDNINKTPEDLSLYQTVEVDDIVINKMKAWQGSLGISKFRGITSPDYAVFQPRHAESSLFLDYLLRCKLLPEVYKSISNGIRPDQWRIEADSFLGLTIPLPPLQEQDAIAVFLEREVTKIDALVAEQEQLIALLEEKRQAVISHAVTKGLDPSAPMKDSGVEWLGEMPAHWPISRIKHFCSHVVDCLHTTPTYDGELLYPAIRTADIERGILLLSQARLVNEEVYIDRIQRLEPRCGDILYSREGERFGMAAQVPENTKLCLGQRMMMFRVVNGVCSEYVMWLLNSDIVYKQVLSTVGGATSPHVNIADVINFRVPEPPYSEQIGIARYIAGKAFEYDELIAKADAAIALLQERRSALVAAAVTGKIDVRGLVADKEAA